MHALRAINPFLASRFKRVASSPRPQPEQRSVRYPEPEQPVYARLPRAPKNASPVPHLTSLYHFDDDGKHRDHAYPGNCGGNLIRDLLLYFQPEGIVFDPMSGSGTCADVCQELGLPCMSWDIHRGLDACEKDFAAAGKRCWLWLAATVAAFVVHARRGLAGLQALLGEVIAGIVVSDRWKVYEVLPDGRRQLCWAHLLRDFRALAERTGISRRIGENLLALSGVLFEYWPKVRDGTHSREWFQGEVLSAIRPDVASSLRRGLRSRCAATRGMCRELLAWESSMWTFAFVASAC